MDDVAVAGVMVTALGTVFSALSFFKNDVPAQLETVSQSVTGLIRPIICPNCSQPFDVLRSYTTCGPFPVVNGVRIVTCPRCTYTFEA